uniref:CHCH domain-containing protein n=1 Tax=Globodera pallida TaxID=36090 RepID=A0A183C1K3_GLOPA
MVRRGRSSSPKASGHALGNMFSGGGQEVTPQQELPVNSAGFEKVQQYSQSCEIEWRQFLDCTQNQGDVSICQGFNDLFKECKAHIAR